MARGLPNLLRKLVVDSSTLIALERGGLLDFLNKIDLRIIVTESVIGEIGNLKPQDLHLRNLPTSVREKANSNLDGAQEPENMPRTLVRGFLTNLQNSEVETLNGKSIKLRDNLIKLGIGKGEADCLIIANKLKMDFIVCDDRKLLRQLFFSDNNKLKNFKIFGFSFFLHEFYKKGLINDVWRHFDIIIEKCNWERSEVQVSNYVFLKGLNY